MGAGVLFDCSMYRCCGTGRELLIQQDIFLEKHLLLRRMFIVLILRIKNTRAVG